MNNKKWKLSWVHWVSVYVRIVNVSYISSYFININIAFPTQIWKEYSVSSSKEHGKHECVHRAPWEASHDPSTYVNKFWLTEYIYFMLF